MPQPIRRPKLVHFDFEPSSILREANLAAQIPVINALWNDMETRIALFLATLLHTDPRTLVSMFLAITNDGARRAAIDAVCKEQLDETQRESFQKVLTTVGNRYKDRNTVVHCAWGVSNDFPDKLLWCDPKEVVILHADMMSLMGADQNDARFHRMMEFQNSVILYEQRDFTSIIDRLRAARLELEQYTQPFVDRAYGTSRLVMPTPPPTPPRGSPGKSGPSGK